MLQQLHWLSVQSRIDFKFLILTYKVVHGLAPVYIRDLVIPSISSRSLSALLALSVSATLSTKNYGGGGPFPTMHLSCRTHYLHL